MELVLGSVVSIQVGRPRNWGEPTEAQLDGQVNEGPPQRAWTSAIVKEPIVGPVYIGPTNLAGDEQADLVHHGGVDKAVLAYSLDHYPGWRELYPERDFSPGAFGENLSVAGVQEADCCVGDVIAIGECVLEISQPRQPCWKLSRRWNLAQLAAKVQTTGRSGWYLRVLSAGVIEAGQSLRLIARPHPEFTIAWANRVMHHKPYQAADDLRLAACPPLSASWKESLLKRAMRGKTPDVGLRLEGQAT